MNWLLLVGTYAIGYLDGYKSAKKEVDRLNGLINDMLGTFDIVNDMLDHAVNENIKSFDEWRITPPMGE